MMSSIYNQQYYTYGYPTYIPYYPPFMANPWQGGYGWYGPYNQHMVIQNLINELLYLLEHMQNQNGGDEDDIGEVLSNPRPPLQGTNKAMRPYPTLADAPKILLDNDEIPSSLKGIHIISSQEQLDDFAQLLGIEDAASLPRNIDFSERALVYETRSAGDHNQVVMGGVLDSNGTLNIINPSTLMAEFPSNQTKIDFYTVDRDGIENLGVRNSPYNTYPLA